MEFIACIILFVVIFVNCKMPEWKANNRVSPPGMKTDWGKMSEDRILNGMSQRDIYKKQSQGGYDVPEKNKNTESGLSVWEDFKKRHPHGSWN